ncbi:energy transducer TonB [Parendozoicomonas sp. Alg238-R29]|uniref:energy transducer TonB n=1 Tax=Parendozoicomonas sp. Alg238-R29 TaxID=2993446 RepID=UPI00248E9898|nr:energy transducer TonB [Parendozoicomonas sp. Alg238-R29]
MAGASSVSARLPVVLIAGVTGSFLLFSLLHSLLYQPATASRQENTAPIKVTTVYTAVSPNQPQESQESSPGHKPVQPNPPLNTLTPTFTVPAIAVDTTTIPDTGRFLATLPDLPALAPAAKPQVTPETDIVTLFSVPPEYPHIAKRRGIEGWVDIRFTITANGSVEDMEIIDAQPSGIFEKSALKALKHYKFKPREINGKKVARKARQRLRFQP